MAKSLINVVVLPVPGPPVIILNLDRKATTQAIFCQSGDSLLLINNSCT